MADLQIEGISVAGISGCHLRRSTRARHLRIELRPDRSLLVVIPTGMREDQWLSFVLSKKRWIERNLNRLGSDHPEAKVKVVEFPLEIELLSTSNKYKICRTTGHQNRASLVNDSLHLVCTDTSDDQSYQLMRRWLMGRARVEFTHRLDSMSKTAGLDWCRLSIRGQKTRWGSCSAKGNISLNFKLLFLPSNLVDHVLLHELAHVRELNHSQNFWALLKNLDPYCEQHRIDLKKAGQLLPDWIVKL
jgi:predicted metal-dependent hydrolase